MPQVTIWVFVGQRHPAGVSRLVDRELDGEIMTGLRVRVAAEIRQRFPLFLGHVVAVGYPCAGDGLPPLVAAGRMVARMPDAVPYVVVIPDGVLRLAAGGAGATSSGTRTKQVRIEQPLLCVSVHFEQDRQPIPDWRELPRVIADLVQKREHPALFVMIGQDQLGNIHGSISSPRRIPAPDIALLS